MVCGHYCLLFIYYRSHGFSFASSVCLIQCKYSDASAARTVLDLANTFKHLMIDFKVQGQTCNIKDCHTYLCSLNENYRELNEKEK